MYLLLFNNLCCGLSLPPYGSKLLLMFCPNISSAELLVHPKQTYFAIKRHSWSTCNRVVLNSLLKLSFIAHYIYSFLKYNACICPATSSVRQLVSIINLFPSTAWKILLKSITLQTAQISDEICKWHGKHFIIAPQVTVMYNFVL